MKSGFTFSESVEMLPQSETFRIFYMLQSTDTEAGQIKEKTDEKPGIRDNKSGKFKK